MTKVTREMVDWCRGLVDGTLDPNVECYYFHRSGIGEVTGLCAPFYKKFHVYLHEVVDYMHNYPDYSGKLAYPVRLTLVTPEKVYNNCLKNGGMWDFTTEYGQNRKSFVEWAIKELEKHL